jgi:hypothetical protein
VYDVIKRHKGRPKIFITSEPLEIRTNAQTVGTRDRGAACQLHTLKTAGLMILGHCATAYVRRELRWLEI